MLHVGGAINQLGSVDHGTAVTDFEEQERERRSRSRGTVPCRAPRQINTVDCPGYSEFYVDALYGLWATDNALLVLDAARAWRCIPSRCTTPPAS